MEDLSSHPYSVRPSLDRFVNLFLRTGLVIGNKSVRFALKYIFYDLNQFLMQMVE